MTDQQTTTVCTECAGDPADGLGYHAFDCSLSGLANVARIVPATEIMLLKREVALLRGALEEHHRGHTFTAERGCEHCARAALTPLPDEANK